LGRKYFKSPNINVRLLDSREPTFQGWDYKGGQSMKIKFFLVLILVVSALFLSTFYFTRPPESPERTAERFTENLFMVAPPTLDKAAISHVIDQLSDKAKKQIKSLRDIAYFSGVRELPDRGFATIDVNKKGNKAFVKMKWHYSGGEVIKEFFMVFENGRWKIDRIQSQK
jgi:hypothetical protein